MLPFVVGIGCTVAGGWLGDMMVGRGVGKTFARKAFAVGGLFAATIFTILGALSPASMTTPAIVSLTLSIASFSFATAAVNSMTIDIAPTHVVSSLVSLQNFGGNVGGSFAPVVTGVSPVNTGSFLAPLLVTAGVALIFGPIGYRAYQTYFALPPADGQTEVTRGLWYAFTVGSMRVISLANDDVVYQDGGDSYVRAGSRRGGYTTITVTYFDVVGTGGELAPFETFTLRRPRRD